VWRTLLLSFRSLLLVWLTLLLSWHTLLLSVRSLLLMWHTLLLSFCTLLLSSLDLLLSWHTLCFLGSLYGSLYYFVSLFSQAHQAELTRAVVSRTGNVRQDTVELFYIQVTTPYWLPLLSPLL
jgi:hypothetical protein